MLHTYSIRGTPDVYTIAVNSCSQTGDLEFALTIYNDMKNNGVVPDEVIVSARSGGYINLICHPRDFFAICNQL